MSTSRIDLVINTGPIIALSVGLEHPKAVLGYFNRVFVPKEVADEIHAGNPEVPGRGILDLGSPVVVLRQDSRSREDLALVLDSGEAAVIQTALGSRVRRVCIDEAVGRRVARLNGLAVTGSLGLIIHAIRHGESIDLPSTIHRMKDNGIWLSEQLEQQAIRLAKG